MFGSTILDTAIGITFVFLLVGLLVTTANEMIAAALKSRARWLRKGIRSLLGSEWANRLYDHPLIEGYSGDSPLLTRIFRLDASGPSYIPSRTFAGVVMDFLANSNTATSTVRDAMQGAIDTFPGNTGTVAALKQAIGVSLATVGASANQHKGELGALLGQLPIDSKQVQILRGKLATISSNIADPALLQTKNALEDLAREIGRPEFTYVRSQVLDKLQGIIDAVQYVGTTTAALKQDLTGLVTHMGDIGYSVEEAKKDLQAFVDALSESHLRDAIAQVPSASLRQTFTVLLDEAKRNSEKFTQNIEIWFDNGMDRVGGWYKRRSQLVVLGLAALVTVVVNVDTLSILRQLSTQSGLRDALVAQAKTFADSAPVALPSPQSTAPTPGSENLETKFKTIQNQLAQLNLPIGWYRASTSSDNGGAPSKQAIEFRQANFLLLPTPDTLGDTIYFHIIGWLLTAIAASLGAPFWFDTLNKFMAIRSVGKAPEESPKPPKEVPTPLGPGQSQQVADVLAATRKR